MVTNFVKRSLCINLFLDNNVSALGSVPAALYSFLRYTVPFEDKEVPFKVGKKCVIFMFVSLTCLKNFCNLRAHAIVH